MMGRQRQENLDGPSGGGNDGGGGTTDGGGGVGHTCNNGGANEVFRNTYNDFSSSCGGSSATADKFARTKSLNFDMFPSLNSTTICKCPADAAGGMAASVEFPFTSAQWKELERQAIIYKYMVASMPLPRDLLYPPSRNFPGAASDPSNCLSGGEIYNVRCSRIGDPEPGRCKRTDGKKWRCSRDVAPQQKYCERHLHKGRSRSRKPVEVKNSSENHKKTHPEQSPLPTLQAHNTASHQFSTANESLLLFDAKTDLSISTPYKDINRELGLMLEGDLIGLREAENNWQNLMKTNMGLPNEVSSSIYSSSAPIFHQDYVERQPLNAFSFSNFPAPEAPSGYIDAWSIDNYNNSDKGNVESCVSPDPGNLSPSLNLSIAMAAGNVLDEEISKIQVGNGLKDSDARWLNPVSWELFARGGPLAEALHQGSVGVWGSNPASPYDSNSTPATTVSSPSGVLHRTLFSHSENSVCNSPTILAPSSETAFQWLN